MGAQIEEYINAQSGVNFTKVFDQYLRTANIPTFEYRITGDSLEYRWANAVPGFDMPLRVTLDWPRYAVIRPRETWQKVAVRLPRREDFKVDVNYYVVPRDVTASSR